MVQKVGDMCFIKRYFADEYDTGRNGSERCSPSIPTQFDAEIENIFDHWVVSKSKKNSST